MNSASEEEDMAGGEERDLKLGIVCVGEEVQLEDIKKRANTHKRLWPEYHTNSFDEEEEEEKEKKPKILQKKKRYLQRYSSKTFENDPELQGWVTASSRGSQYAYCIICETHLNISSGKADLKKHASMKKHLNNLQASLHSDTCITACVPGQDQPIASVRVTSTGKHSETDGRKRKPQMYSPSFEEDPLLADWITASAKGEHYAHCIPCDIDIQLNKGKMGLRQHVRNKKHMTAREELNQRQMLPKSQKVEQCFSTFLPARDCQQTSDMSVLPPSIHLHTSTGEMENTQKSPVTLEISSPKSPVKPRNKEEPRLSSSRLLKAECQIASFIAQHGLSLDMSDHLIHLIRSVCPYSNVAQSQQFGESNMLHLINNVLGKEGHEKLMQIIQENKFSLIVDESIGRGSEKYLIMLVRVLHNYSIDDAFLGLIPMKDATADSLYNDIVDFFRNNLIPYKHNMIGIAADGGNAVLGGSHSLVSLMKADMPQLFVLKCISHSFSLCASSACLKLPQLLEDLARDLYSYFQFRPSHTKLEGLEAFTCVKPHKLLHPGQTRLLSVHAVVSKILEKYNALKSYFVSATLVDNLEASETILQRLSMPVTELYLMFLDFVLPIFVNLDRHLQSESTQIHVLHNAVGMALNAIFECYLKDSYLRSTPLKDIDYRDERNFRPLGDMYLGIKVQMEITSFSSLQDKELKDFRMNCLEFLIESIAQIYERFPYGSHVLESLENLNPKVVIERNVPSLIDLICNFENLATPDIQIVDNEWRLLRNMVDTLPISSSMKPEVFWDTVSRARQIDNVLMCPNLSEFMFKLLCLPSAAAPVEKVFATVNKIKAKSKNISTENLMGMMYSNQPIR